VILVLTQGSTQLAMLWVDYDSMKSRDAKIVEPISCNI
jgi:hypothetical protein